MQPNCVYIGVSRLIRFEFDGFPKLVKRLVMSVQPHQGQTECMMNAPVSGRRNDGTAKYPFAIAIPSELSIEI